MWVHLRSKKKSIWITFILETQVQQIVFGVRFRSKRFSERCSVSGQVRLEQVVQYIDNLQDRKLGSANSVWSLRSKKVQQIMFGVRCRSIYIQSGFSLVPSQVRFEQIGQYIDNLQDRKLGSANSVSCQVQIYIGSANNVRCQVRLGLKRQDSILITYKIESQVQEIVFGVKSRSKQVQQITFSARLC